jgi:hypothetical protein
LARGVIPLAASVLLVLGAPMAAIANDDIHIDEDSHVQQVIPPVMLDEGALEMVSEPLNVETIVITDRTPADTFVNATTPLVVALMLGSVGLVIYTLTRVESKD